MSCRPDHRWGKASRCLQFVGYYTFMRLHSAHIASLLPRYRIFPPSTKQPSILYAVCRLPRVWYVLAFDIALFSFICRCSFLSLRPVCVCFADTCCRGFLSIDELLFFHTRITYVLYRLSSFDSYTKQTTAENGILCDVNLVSLYFFRGFVPTPTQKEASQLPHLRSLLR